MTDIDKANALDWLNEIATNPKGWRMFYSDSETEYCVKTTIAMLKEQEAQFVLNIGQQISCKSGSCPKCGKMLNTTCNKRYCGDCGQSVKWE